MCSVHPRSSQGSWNTVFTTLCTLIFFPASLVPAQCVPGGISHGFHPIFLGDRLEQRSDPDWRRQKSRIMDFDHGRGRYLFVFSVVKIKIIETFAGYLAYVLTHLPPQELNNRTLRIEGQRCSYLQIAEKYGDTVKIVHAPQFPEDIDNHRLRGYLQTKAEAGAGTVTYDVKTSNDEYKLDNDLWPGHHWLTVRETLGL